MVIGYARQFGIAKKFAFLQEECYYSTHNMEIDRLLAAVKLTRAEEVVINRTYGETNVGSSDPVEREIVRRAFGEERKDLASGHRLINRFPDPRAVQNAVSDMLEDLDAAGLLVDND